MATLLAVFDPLPVVRAIRAAADVVVVKEGDGFCASVVVIPGATPVARLDRSLRGAAHEGTVLYEVMTTTMSPDAHGLYVWRLSPEGVLIR